MFYQSSAVLDAPSITRPGNDTCTQVRCCRISAAPNGGRSAPAVPGIRREHYTVTKQLTNPSSTPAPRGDGASKLSIQMHRQEAGYPLCDISQSILLPLAS